MNGSTKDFAPFQKNSMDINYLSRRNTDTLKLSYG